MNNIGFINDDYKNCFIENFTIILTTSNRHKSFKSISSLRIIIEVIVLISTVSIKWIRF